MTLRESKGNMYEWVTHTWNAIKGKCPYDCSYCYMKRFPQGELRFDEKELKTKLGEGNFIFVGSSTDMFSDEILDKWIEKTLEHCNNYPKNTYLFQTKNPVMFHKWKNDLPTNSILGTTIETDRDTPSKAPKVAERIAWMSDKDLWLKRKMITIEPIMDFDVLNLIWMIKEVRPEFVSIGADSQGHNLKEPLEFKIHNLIKQLRKFTKVNLKDNLKRILNGGGGNSL